MTKMSPPDRAGSPATCGGWAADQGPAMVRISPMDHRQSGSCVDAPVPSAGPGYPEVAMVIGLGIDEACRMQVISPRRRRIRPAVIAPVLGSGLVGATLIVTGLVLGWLVLATPVLRSF